MTDSKARGAEPSLFQGLASSPVREATRRATRRFCKLFQPAHERENRPYTRTVFERDCAV